MIPLPLAPSAKDSQERQRVADDLSRLDVGQVVFDRHDRMLYATDGSIYQEEPIGVVIPREIAQVERILMYCQANRIAVLPRGGGTSLAGQCTNHAIVVDLSAFCRRIISVDVANRRCHVEPGVTIDELNRQLGARQTGLFFAPDPATVAQAAIGGCIGNNAAGARSIRYGRTSENVTGVDVVLSDGRRAWLESGAGRRSPIALALARGMAQIVGQYAQQIRARFPRLIRRNAGYGLDLVLRQLDGGVAVEDVDLSGLICGSEGTLGVVVGAKLKLESLPIARGLALVSYPSVAAAIDAVGPIVATRPTAVELLDDVVLEAAGGNNECRNYLQLMPPIDGRLPKAVLYVEYTAEHSADEVPAGFARLRQVVGGAPTNELTGAGAMGEAWALRKAGEPLLHGLSATRKPQTFVEDNSIPIEQLPRFVAEFRKIVAQNGTSAAYYAHASVGVLHVRPLIDLHEPADRERMRKIAVQVADLARDCGGVMSGEHGDGKARGPLLERFFGSELMQAFVQTKALFDPAGILNPNDIVNVGPIETITEKLRVRPEKREIQVPPVDTFYEYEDQHGFEGAVEMCNGAGFCRKTAGGTMCPSYRATLDERHSTRGRGNALRLAITGQLSDSVSANEPKWNDADTIKTLDLCLSCKACKSECPSNVDVARLKAEYTAQRYRQTGVPLAERVFGNIRLLNQCGSAVANLANWLNLQPYVRGILNHVLGLAPRRTLPAFETSLFHWFAHRPRALPPRLDRPRVVLFGDCFTAYTEPAIGVASVRVMEKLGYDVTLGDAGCCGRAPMSTGLLERAIAVADRTLANLQPAIEDERVVAIIVCEPSCLSAMKDDWLHLKLKTPRALRQKLAAKAISPEDFVETFWDRHPDKPAPRASEKYPEVIMHGHCHQKALWGETSATAILRRLAGDRVRVLASGCCGMAGSFGYTAAHYELSMKIGELSVFPPIRDAEPGAAIVAPGTSCRHQIKDGTGKQARHPIELITELLLEGDP